MNNTKGRSRDALLCGHHRTLLSSDGVTADEFSAGSIHIRAMPVILITSEEIETWLTAPTEEALKLQRPLPDGALEVVARGERQGDPPKAVDQV